MKSHLKGRVKNVVLAKANGLLPLFEAVVNSIQAIEDRHGLGDLLKDVGKVDVHIKRQDGPKQSDPSPGRPPERPISSFEIVDNGSGFNDENWAAFQVLDFTNKMRHGCRGVGRLAWLKAFSKVRIESWYEQDGLVKGRFFQFSLNDGATLLDQPAEASADHIGSKVFLEGFQPRYAQAVEKTAEAIANRLLEHLLWNYVSSNGVPRITIHDDDAHEALILNEILNEKIFSDSESQDFEIKGEKFNVTHVRIRGKSSRRHVISYCASRRLVKEESLDIPGLNNSISDEAGPFQYAGYVVGDYLDQRVHPERTDIEMEEETNGLFSDSEVSRADLRKALKPMVEEYLGETLLRNIAAGRERIGTYIENVAPQYLPIVKTFPIESMVVDPNISNAQLEKILHNKKYEVEQNLLEKGEKLLNPDMSDNYDDYKDRVNDYLRELDQVKQSDLAAYVAHRRIVLDLLRIAMRVQDDGGYAREEALHSLIMPMNSTSEQIESLRGSNLWLIDERLAFHQHYLGSNKTLTSIPNTGANGRERPDIAGINLYEWIHDNPHAFSNTGDGNQAEITIVEIKRPMRGGYGAGRESDPIEQAYDYLRLIRDGGVMDRTGRNIPNADRIPAYIYVVADLTPSMRKRCDNFGLNASPDGLSYFGYNPSATIRAYTEVIDFQGILTYANERNAAFFQRLGLPPQPAFAK